MFFDFHPLGHAFEDIQPICRCGYVSAVGPGGIDAIGLGPMARVGDMTEVVARRGPPMRGEVVALSRDAVRIMTYTAAESVGLDDVVRLIPQTGLRPHSSWRGRIIDAFGRPLDGRTLEKGMKTVDLRAAPPDPARRAPLGPRIGTGLAAFDTMLPLARGQRIGIFAGSGVGKSSLLAKLARGVEADIVVFALIGERGREVRHFTDNVLGPEGMKQSVVIAATSDQSPLIKRRAAWMAMAVAEFFRDEGRHVLLLADSVTRLAEAHREVALTAGEAPSLRAFPPSTSNLIAGFAERAGPAAVGTGAITGIFSVLVAGSDMEEPVADITRGLLDGHVVLDRDIAERGRFPAIDVRRSVSRALPDVASAEENALIERVRRVLGSYEVAAPMIQTGLYVPGSDATIDEAIRVWPALDAFFARDDAGTPAHAFAALRGCFKGP